VSSPDLKQGVVLFIAFGLTLALVWARLGAPDLALAEAAIGAGLSGALLLSALRDAPREVPAPTPLPLAAVIGLLTLALAAAYAWALVSALQVGDPVRLSGQVADQLANSGVGNPVTAVLLNFRAYDTLLELAVLAAAVLGILALNQARPSYRPAGPLLGGLVRWLVPLLLVTAGYLLWAGAQEPGGAFQAGALLASAAVLLRLSGHPGAGLPGPAALRWLLAGGVAAFLAVGIAVTPAGLAFLQYPEGWAGVSILLIEAAATLSIAATLALAYLGGRPAGFEPPSEPPPGGQQEN
jgi:multisubunit Na+/H+ antiporter MnhB subunit